MPNSGSSRMPTSVILKTLDPSDPVRRRREATTDMERKGVSAAFLNIGAVVRADAGADCFQRLMMRHAD